MSYSISGVSPQSSQTSLAANDLYGGLGSLNSQSKTPYGQQDSFKTTTLAKPPSTYATEKTVAPPKPTPVAQPHTVDAVKLSLTNQVRNLRNQGEDDSQIATTLHLSTKEVQDDLYVATNFPHVLSTAAQAAAGQSAGDAATSGAPTVAAPKP
jgi:hypothetical protein